VSRLRRIAGPKAQAGSRGPKWTPQRKFSLTSAKEAMVLTKTEWFLAAGTTGTAKASNDTWAADMRHESSTCTQEN
jgi:hypothetical protein